MKFTYTNKDWTTIEQGEQNCWLLTNGLGGYMSTTAVFSVNRCDSGLLAAAVSVPNERRMLVHRLSERMSVNGTEYNLSSQRFADGTQEQGFRHLTRFVWDDAGPCWTYQLPGVEVVRRCAMAREKNTAAVLYEIRNHTAAPCTLTVTPWVVFQPKGEPLQKEKPLILEGNCLCAQGEEMKLHLRTNGSLMPTAARTQSLYYAADEQDGRAAMGLAQSCCQMQLVIPAGEQSDFEVLFSTESVETTAKELISAYERRQKRLKRDSGFTTPIARQLACAADAFLVQRHSTGGRSIIAGYPLFGDWGRDTMIALSGCALATKQYAVAKSILRTFLAYEKDGLVPNLFPEDGKQPMYNTVDAALLLINAIWLYEQSTGDITLVREAFPVMKRIVRAYRSGTHYGIHMDTDGLICAGEGLAQVTWMDVCVDGVLPTPRHGKPVEINAYWYSALCIMSRYAALMEDGEAYAALAERVKASFRKNFWIAEKGHLKDVISGTRADEQLRCNQIWALTMPFTMLTTEQERSVVDAVYRHLFTPYGLRTLSPEDAEYHGFYGGSQFERDMAYHQGTIWPFPMGAFYLAYLKVHEYSPEHVQQVQTWLNHLEVMLKEGCVGQIPEVYDGDHPGISKGCYAQAWSVGELLRAMEEVEKHLSLRKEA